MVIFMEGLYNFNIIVICSYIEIFYFLVGKICHKVLKTKLFKACVKKLKVKTVNKADTKKRVPKDAMFIKYT
jgi:hypothetical protein